ncbi:MAG TPA: 3'(2'),5'-bisphosphate nucleotidase CysQ [Polyangia bacterium]
MSDVPKNGPATVPTDFLAAELAIARSAALEAAALVAKFRGSTTLSVEHKTGDEPVTEADRLASELILRRLEKAFPTDAILSEEAPDDGRRLSHSRVWMVDPIDGTRDFINGDDGFCVMIGLCIDGRPRLGVLAMPANGDLYEAVVGVGGWKVSADGTRTPLKTSTLTGPPGIRLVASKSHRTKDVDGFRKAMQITDEVNVGSIGVKVAMVASDQRDLYVYPGSRTKIWDSCAPEAVILAAGGRITDVRGNALSYTEPGLVNRGGLVASNGPLHDRVLETLATLVGTRILPG